MKMKQLIHALTGVLFAVILGSCLLIGVSANGTEYSFGNLNDDEVINTTDVVLLRRYIAGGYGVELPSVLVKDEKVYEYLDSVFELQEDTFVCTSGTPGNPAWSYTTSTFSGWGGSIGKPSEIDAIAVRIRARDEAITQIKFHLNVNDKNGESIASEIVDVYIPPREEREIVWNVPTKRKDNTDFLYFSYNCNQLCDVYSDFTAKSIIPEEDYQAILTYTVNGRLLDSASQMTDGSGRTPRYLYVRFGSLRGVMVPREDVFVCEEEVLSHEKVNVFLPDEYDITVNDNFQLFYRGVVQAVNPYHYSIKILCDKGIPYSRYFEWKPSEEDAGSSYNLTMIVHDNNGIELGRDTTVLRVHKPVTEHEMQNVLCIGASATSNGYWVSEMRRRFTETGGAIEGLGLNYLNFVGSRSSTIDGKEIRHEGHPGWSWTSFCGNTSPFYDEELQDISFRSYCEKNGIEDLDIVYVLLAWNGQKSTYDDSFTVDSGHFANARRLIDKLHEEYPNAIVRCMGGYMPSQNGGMGYNYGASNVYGDDYGMLVSGMNFNQTMEKMCQLEQYRDFVKYVDIAGQFDTEYNFPSAKKPVNNRSKVTETVETNGLHPTVDGYYQIADAAFRSLCEVFSQSK